MILHIKLTSPDLYDGSLTPEIWVFFLKQNFVFCNRFFLNFFSIFILSSFFIIFLKKNYFEILIFERVIEV